MGRLVDSDGNCGYTLVREATKQNTGDEKMVRTYIITSKSYKKLCSVVCGTSEQVAALLRFDSGAHGFDSYSPSDWDYRGDVIDLDQTPTRQACIDILNGNASLPESHRWLVR